MPRTLPWLAEKAAKRECTAKAKGPIKTRSLPSADLVGSDLEDLDEDPTRFSHRGNKKKATYREPSSSPPPVVTGPPPVEAMRTGYAADDGWMMVEDEFYSTAQLFTQHLHQEAYANLKRLHKSRGQETLAGLARGTDGRTAQSRQLQLKLQADDNTKKRKQAMAGESGSEDEDEYLLDPQLAGLMTGSQVGHGQHRSRAAQVTSRRSLAEDGDDSSDPLPEPEPDLSPVVDELEDEDEDTESDDLGKPTRKQLLAVKTTTGNRKASTITTDPAPKVSAPRVFKQFAGPRVEEQEPAKNEVAASSVPSSPPSRLPAPRRKKPGTIRPRSPSPIQNRTFTSRDPSLVKHEDSSSPIIKSSLPTSVQVMEEPGSRVSAFLAQRRAQKEKEQADAKRKEIEDSIPTFLF